MEENKLCKQKGYNREEEKTLEALLGEDGLALMGRKMHFLSMPLL